MRQHQRFLTKIKKAKNGCWNWTASVTVFGYSQFHYGGKQGKGHRYSYEHYKGAIPKGLSIDHLCRNRKCVNPDHLEAVTNKENVMRGIGLTAQHARKTECINGHDLTGTNLYTYHYNGNPVRQCKACQVKRRHDYYSKNRSRILRKQAREAGSRIAYDRARYLRLKALSDAQEVVKEILK